MLCCYSFEHKWRGLEHKHTFQHPIQARNQLSKTLKYIIVIYYILLPCYGNIPK